MARRFGWVLEKQIEVTDDAVLNTFSGYLMRTASLRSMGEKKQKNKEKKKKSYFRVFQ
jgi:uncharacterized protein YcbX